MFRYQILIEYEGTNFRGWQIQKKGKTVQGLLQDKISKLLKEKVIVYGAGRLDVGVHAKEQAAHFDCKNNQSIKVLEIQRQGKRPQKTSEFMLGSKIKKGFNLTNV